MNRAALAIAICLAGPCVAMDLSLPATARLTVERNTSPDRYAAPTSVFDQGEVKMITVEGDVHRAAWRIESPGLTALQVMRPLRTQLVDSGYEILLDCDSAACGGFDFRFAIETLPGPNMYVNIRSFHFLSAVRLSDEAPQDIMTVLTSTSATSAYVQIIQAGALLDGGAGVETTDPVPVSSGPAPTGDLATALIEQGHAILGDLDFESGTTELGAGPFASLAAIAATLSARPELRVALVGHTDAVGSLQANIALSRRRAQSVRQRLITEYGIAAGRLDAEGMGYLAPVATNQHDQGRDANRRVEVVLLNTK